MVSYLVDQRILVSASLFDKLCETVGCHVRRAKPCGQVMGELPPQHAKVDSYPFSSVAVDYFGNFWVTSEGRACKQ